jgi:predicted O-methyltransferase YrrM
MFPLVRYAVELRPEFFERLRPEPEQALASDVYAVHDASAFQYSKMLGDLERVKSLANHERAPTGPPSLRFRVGMAHREGNRVATADRLRIRKGSFVCIRVHSWFAKSENDRYLPKKMSLNFEPRVMRVLEEIERFGLSHDSTQTDRKQKMLNLERSTAELIHILLLSSGRKRVLEIGTSNGFSAIIVGATLQSIDGAVPLTTIERDPIKVGGARRNIEHAKLSFIVQVIQGSATEVINELTGPFDCVFFDADRVSAPEQLRLLLPKLEPDVLLLADNVLSHPQEVQAYIDAVAQLPGFVAATVPVGKGLHIAYRREETIWSNRPGVPEVWSTEQHDSDKF